VGNRRRPAAVSAAVRAPLRLRLGVGNKRPSEVLCVLGNRLERSANGESERRRKSPAVAAMASGVARWRTEREKDGVK
jgi:hypothetical protein